MFICVDDALRDSIRDQRWSYFHRCRQKSCSAYSSQPSSSSSGSTCYCCFDFLCFVCGNCCLSWGVQVSQVSYQISPEVKSTARSRLHALLDDFPLQSSTRMHVDGSLLKMISYKNLRRCYLQKDISMSVFLVMTYLILGNNFFTPYISCWTFKKWVICEKHNSKGWENV